MPHLTLEYTTNLVDFDVASALRRINQTVIDSGLFDEGDVKSRAVPLKEFLVGIKSEGRTFLHLTVAMSARGQGPESDMAKALGEVLVEALGSRRSYCTQACVEIVHVNTSTYVKRVLDRANV
ncbi:unannotated protein [freshwater metagenome]|uniref:Unannotated protein n=1 Tax=freshwater metagenome TaxID=449393 RepID=A0A6J7A7K0_9ZZZZ|nr:5-carboxymethyl-2-hydroxymuconate isomerase [Actinomycetota bacterium]